MRALYAGSKAEQQKQQHRKLETSTSMKTVGTTSGTSHLYTRNISPDQHDTPAKTSAAAHQRLPLGSSTPAITIRGDSDDDKSSSELHVNKGGRVLPANTIQAPNVAEPVDAEIPNCTQTSQHAVTVLKENTGRANESQLQLGLSSLSRTADDVPLGITDLIGATNILIPVSTMELFFQRFDMIENHIIELKSLERRNLVSPGISTVPACAATVEDSELTGRILALEGLISKQNSTLVELQNKCDMLLEHNLSLKEKLLDLSFNLDKLQGAHRTINNNNNNDNNFQKCNSLLGTAQTVSDRVDLTESLALGEKIVSSLSRTSTVGGDARSGNEGDCCEIVINGTLRTNCDASAEAVNEIAFAALNTVLPSLERQNIVEARVLQPRGFAEEQNEQSGKSLGPRSKALPSCIVRLESRQMVVDVMRAKRALANNYLTTKDINPKLLSPASATYVPDHKIFFNEMLPHSKFQLYKSLKLIAQKLGFKYIWHSGGRFLVRSKGGERAHVFASAADLQAIQAACLVTPRVNQPCNVKSGNLTNGTARAGDAQASRPATTTS